MYKAAIQDAAVIEQDERLNLIPVTGEKVRVTLEPEVKNICRTFQRDGLNLRLQQLLGLPANDTERFFVVLEADAADMFRPCAEPEITSERCGKLPGNYMFSPDHARFFAGQTSGSYRDDGFPWTRLGYTYDWDPQTSDYGASEYVIRKGALVRVIGIYSTEDYCPQFGCSCLQRF